MSTQYDRKIILVGKSGNGKSSLGNVLLGRREFFEGRSFSAVTKECQLEKTEENASVVDTPGLFDSDEATSLVENALKIQRALQLCPNPHAFLIVLNGSARLTEEERLAFDVLRIIFGEQCLKKAVIVLTHIENELDQMQLNQMFENCSEMRSLIEQCGGRYVRIDNKDPIPEHKEDILILVDEVSENGTDYYKNEYLNVYTQILLEQELTNLDSKPVHDQIKQLSEKLFQAVLEEKERRRLKRFRLKCFRLACFGICIVATAGGVATALSSVCEQNPRVVESLANTVISQRDVVPNVFVQNPQEVASLLSPIFPQLEAAGVLNFSSASLMPMISSPLGPMYVAALVVESLVRIASSLR